MKEAKVVRALWPLLRLYPWAVPVIIVLGVFSSLAEGIGISLFIPFLQSLDQASYQATIENWLVDSLATIFNNVPPEHRLLVISLCIFGSVLLKTSLSYSNSALFGWLDARIGHRLRSGVFEQLLTVNYHFLERSQSGRLLNALTTETWRTNDALAALVDLITVAATLTVYATLLLLISWKLTLVVTLVMLLIALIVKFLTRRVNKLGQSLTRTNATLANRMVEGIHGMKVIRAFGRESYEQERFDTASNRVSNAIMKLHLISEAVPPVYEILAAALLVSIMFVTLQTPHNLPSLLVFIFVLYRLLPKVQELEKARVTLVSLEAAVEEVTAWLDRTNKPYLYLGQTSYQGLKQAITLEQVTFRYNASDKPALQDVSIRIPVGKTTALVGPSGGGKSTLIKILLRLYDITEGKIYVDEYPLHELDLASWRSRIAMVSQDIYIFNTTAQENIAYGRPGASEEEILAASKQADAHAFITQLPQGYGTRLGDRGIRLSGGQQQRIALARAILRNPEILILDEATNALDTASERRIQTAINALSHDRTVIVIAHRLSTVERAAQIIVLDQGRVVEQGTPQHLIQLDGLFAKLYDLQYRTILG